MAKATTTPPPPTQAKLHFPNISSAAWEHPADRAALTALRAVPGMEVAIRTFMGATTERSLRLMYLATAVRVNARQFSKVHRLYEAVCYTLDVKEVPELYIAQNPVLNAMAVGWHKPFVVLHSSMVSTATDEELTSVLGHEMGHVLSGHVLYKTLLQLMLSLSQVFISIPLSGLLLAGLIAALREWDRKSELSADRAGLLATQNLEASLHLLMKLAGGNHLDQMNREEFILQAREYQQSDSMLDNLYKLLNVMGQTHPFATLRVAELLSWAEGGEYEAILQGNYPTGRPAIADDLRQSSEEYKKGFEDFTRPVADVMDEVAKAAEGAAEKAQEIFKHLFRK